jgi:hypothetical protein
MAYPEPRHEFVGNAGYVNLPSVGVAADTQIDTVAELKQLSHALRLVGQKYARARVGQTDHGLLGPMATGHRIIEPDQVQGCPTKLDGVVPIVQVRVADGLELARDGLRVHQVVVVAEHEESAGGRQPIEQTAESRERCGATAGEVASQEAQIGAGVGEQRDGVADTSVGRDHADVYVAEMADPHAVVLGLELGEPHRPLAHEHVGIEPNDAA